MDLLFILSTVLCAGTFQHTPRTLRIAKAWKAAIKGLTNKELAAYQGIDEGQCHNQIEGNGTNPGLYRAGELPDETLRAFVQRLAPTLGLLVLDSSDARDLLLEHVIRTKRMASMRPLRREERKDA